MELHRHAAERAVTLVVPNALRSVLQTLAFLDSEKEAEQRVRDGAVREQLQQLQPKWTSRALPRCKEVGKSLRKLVGDFNQLQELVVEHDKCLRDPGVLNLPKARKAQLPAPAHFPKVMG